MMKKLGMFVFVMALVVAFALPAFAYTVEGAKGERFTFGGQFITDFGWRNTDKAYNKIADTTNGPGDRTEFFAILSQSSALIGNLVMGNVSATWVIATQSSLQGAKDEVNGATFQNQKDNDIIDVFYGTYTFGNSYILAGKIGSTFTTWCSPAVMGYAGGVGTHINSIGYGAIYDNKFPQVRFGQNISTMFQYYVALVSPGTYISDPTYGATGTVLSYAQYPAIAAKVTLNFGSVIVIPGAMYQQVKWDNLAAGWDDTMSSWMVVCPVRVQFGPFVGIFGMGYGVNSGGPTGTVSMTKDSTFSGFQRSAAGKILDTTNYNGMIDLSFTFGPVTPHIFYTFTTGQNNKFRTFGPDDSNTRQSYGINAYYSVNKNFTIIPEFAVYDLGKYVTSPYATAAGTDFGKDWLAGVQFKFSF